MEVHIGTKDMEIGKVSLKIRYMSLSKLTWKCSLSLANKHAHIKPFNFDSIKKGEVNIIRMCHCVLGRALNIIKLMHCIGKGNGLIKLPFLFLQIDPRHRYGHNLHFYYDIWFESESVQPFFYW